MSIFRGRGWPAPGEPLFLDDDREHAIAAVLNRHDTCSCGEPISVSTAPGAEFEYRAETVRCHACAAQARAAKDVDDASTLLYRFTDRPDPLKE